MRPVDGGPLRTTPDRDRRATTPRRAITVTDQFQTRRYDLPELKTILALDQCGAGHPCIDPIFGPTSTTDYLNPLNAWSVEFFGGGAGPVIKQVEFHVRAVRGGS